MKQLKLILMLCCTPAFLFAQEKMQDSVRALSRSRLYAVGALHASVYTGTLLVLGQTWYKNYPRTSFHTFNDSPEWLQVDKAGHAWTAYNLAKYSTALWGWTGMKRKKAVVVGGFSAMAFQTVLEFLDAHSSEWGWSWGDMGANAFGAGLFVSQELAFRGQPVQFKFSSHRNSYGPGLEERADKLFGRSLPERLLKDYNAQTYWLSFNLNDLGAGGLPRWLNLSIGYGGQGMFGGFENKAIDASGTITFDRRDIPRQRQWYLSPDIDLTKIRTHKKSVRALLSVLNAIKVPAPALEYSGGKLVLKAVSF